MEDYTTYKLSYWPTEAKKVNIHFKLLMFFNNFKNKLLMKKYFSINE